METQANIDYQRVAQAIGYILHHFKQQPDLREVAEEIHLSPAHFQRLFTDWAGTSPKKFLQYISAEHAKKLLRERHATLSDATFETGFSSTSRLHDLFVNIEGMFPAEYKNGGKNLRIHYDFSGSPFGPVTVASTPKGICYMAFGERENTIPDLFSRFPNAIFRQQKDALQQKALHIFQQNGNEPEEIKLHLKGTDFQLKVWEALVKIPMGGLATYGNIAEEIGKPGASRAVGNAVGSNPVSFLIPCHRVIQSSGAIGGYMWGTVRKAAIIGWESAKLGR